MHPILFFDGYCHLCDGSVQRLIGLDRKRLLRYAPLDGSTADSLLPTGERPDSLILLYKDEIYVKSAAVLKIAELLGGRLKFLYLSYILPKKLRDLLYDFVAKRRYRWWGRRAECRLPGPGEKDLFMP